VSEPNFIAAVNLVANLFVVEHHEKVEQDHMVGSCLGYQRVQVMKKLWVEALGKLRLAKTVGKLFGRGAMAGIF